MYPLIQTNTNILNPPSIFDRKESLTTHCVLNAVISECLRSQSSETVPITHPTPGIYHCSLGRQKRPVGFWVENTLTCSVVLKEWGRWLWEQRDHCDRGEWEEGRVGGIKIGGAFIGWCYLSAVGIYWGLWKDCPVL